MQAVTQSYSTHLYRQIQHSTGMPGNGTAASTPQQASSQAQQNDQTTLSPEGRHLSRTSDTSPAGEKRSGLQTLSKEDLQKVTELKQRDTEVRTHEQAHLSAAGQYAAGGASFSYTTGPDGKRYANGGEVPIDVGKEKTPEATIQKMRTVRRAALAPVNPSSADRSIAAQASAKEAQARQEILRQTYEVGTNSGSTVNTSTSQDSQTEANDSPPNIIKAPIADYNRRVMTSAYQAMAALTA